MNEMTRHVYDATLDANSDRKGFFASSTLVTATGFFRLQDLYKTLSDTVLLELKDRGSVNIWSAGCSDGREAYSIALLIHKWIQQHPANNLCRFELRASDITESMIQIGLKNEYGIGGAEVDRLKEYAAYITIVDNKLVSIRNEVKRKIKFIMEDIITHQVSKKYDILICTNVLFYYEMEYRKKIVTKLIKNLDPHGFIYLESIGSRFMRSIGLERISPGNHFFRFLDRTR